MLVDEMKVVLASNFALYLKAANFHWNVEGADFPQYHAFLDSYYNDIYSTIDQLAEYIRALNAYTPASFSRFTELSIITDQTEQLAVGPMFLQLQADNSAVLELLMNTFKTTQTENQQGIANFLAERIDAMQKHAWMIRSILKTA
jgi:starvation-inducible DNA-binding protein